MADIQITRREVAKFDGDLPPLFKRIYAARGISCADELELSLKKLLPPDELNQVHLAADRVQRAVMSRERILVVGDFDADGATSVALALSLLRAMGADDVDFLVPNRFEFGYGLSPDIVRLAADLEPALLITVDNGLTESTARRRLRVRQSSAVVPQPARPRVAGGGRGIPLVVHDQRRQERRWRDRRSAGPVIGERGLQHA